MNLINKMTAWLGLSILTTTQPKFVRNEGELEVGYRTDKPMTKTPLSPKQVSRRAKAKRGKQARKLNRRING